MVAKVLVANALVANAIVISGALVASVTPTRANAQTPTANRAALLSADRSFGTNSANTDLISGVSAMFADSITLIALGEQFHGISAAREALNRNADNVKSTMTWTPLQGDVSADGNIGYTMGFTTWKKPDGSLIPGKYVAFWTNQRGAWRVLVYKRTARGVGEVSTAEEAAPLKPAASQTKFTAADSVRFAHELYLAERGFSDQAAVIGLGAALTNNSATDAHHTGGANDADFVAVQQTLVRESALVGNHHGARSNGRPMWCTSHGVVMWVSPTA